MKQIYANRTVLAVVLVLSLVMLSGCTGDKGDTIYLTSYEVPGAPTNIQAVAGDGEVTIRWSPAEGATSYNIYWNTTGSTTTADNVLISTPSPYVHTGLTNGTTYYYVVTAVNIEGESAVSSEASATPADSTTSNPPSAPSNVQATAADGQITISWSPVSGATTYNIHWNTSGSVTTSDTAIINAPSPYVHMNLANGTVYYYAVTAINEYGESILSTEVSGIPQTTVFPPAAPMNVQAIGGDGQITISWSPVAGATSYNIYWNTTGSVTTSDNVITNASSPYVHLNLPGNTTFYYAVTAININGESGLSAEVSAVPTLFSQMIQKITASDAQAWDDFGYSVSISGDYAIVGAHFKPNEIGNQIQAAGAAYIFHKTGPNTWDAGTKIVAPDAQPVDQFGISVSISGDYAIVGAVGEDGGEGDPMPDAGAAYIFHRTGPNTWDAGLKIVSPEAKGLDLFGVSVSISGDYAIVGAPVEGETAFSYALNGELVPEAAYIFHRTGPNIWDTGTKIVSPDLQLGGEHFIFGNTVAISGDYAVVGATYGHVAYIFHRTGLNTWDTGTKIVSPDAQIPLVCWSVAIWGDYAAVGARGAVYIYNRTGPNAWDTGTKIVAPDAQPVDQFGISVSISGDYAIVGASNEDGGAGDPMPHAGAAYIYRRTGTNAWDTGTKIVAPDAQANDSFGWSVSISGDHAIVGAAGEDGGAGDPLNGAGAAYIY